MRIRSSGLDSSIGREKRAYAEYRFFTSLAAYERHIGAVDVAVRRDAARGRFVCTVAVDLGHSGHVTTQARAAQPSAAIDRAADRTRGLIRRRIRRDPTLESPGFGS